MFRICDHESRTKRKKAKNKRPETVKTVSGRLKVACKTQENKSVTSNPGVITRAVENAPNPYVLLPETGIQPQGILVPTEETTALYKMFPKEGCSDSQRCLRYTMLALHSSVKVSRSSWSR